MPTVYWSLKIKILEKGGQEYESSSLSRKIRDR